MKIIKELILLSLILCLACSCRIGNQTKPVISSGNEETDALKAEKYLEEGKGFWRGNGTGGFDKEKAREAFQKAADLGNAEAWFYLGGITETDITGDKRFQKAMQYYQKAADQGCPLGLCAQGDIYEYGNGPYDVDYAKAKRLFEEAINQGSLMGYNGLGTLYVFGYGVEVDPEKGIEYYKKALESDEWFTRNNARVNIGRAYNIGEGGLQPDYTKAREMYQAAADDGHSSGYEGMGYLYDYGNGVEQDYVQAAEWYQKAAGAGKPVNYGIMFYEGLGVTQNYDRALEIFRFSANGKSKDALWGMKMLAQAYCNGRGVEKDPEQAIMWARKTIEMSGSGDQIAVEEAQQVLKELGAM